MKINKYSKLYIIVVIFSLNIYTHIFNSNAQEEIKPDIAESLDERREFLKSVNYWVEILNDKNGNKYMSDFPHYTISLMDDPADDIESGYSDVQSSFLCTISSVESFYNTKFITPYDFAEKNSYKGGEEEEIIKNVIVNEIAGYTLSKDLFYSDKITNTIKNGGCAIAHINNPSIFGRNGDWVIVKDILPEGLVCMWDPMSAANDYLCPVAITDDELFLYSIPELLNALGDDEIYYITKDK